MSTPNLLAAKELQEDLELNRINNTPVFIGFWLRVGSGLTEDELRRLRWEHFLDHGDGSTWLCGPLGREGEAVQARLQPMAVSALGPVRKPDGPVFTTKVWTNHLRWLLKYKVQRTLEDLQGLAGGPALVERPTIKRAAGPMLPDQTAPAPVPAPAFSPTPEPEPAMLEVGELLGKLPKPAGGVGAHLEAGRVAALLDMSVQYVKLRIKAGELDGYRLGNRIVVTAESLRSFLENRKIKASASSA